MWTKARSVVIATCAAQYSHWIFIKGVETVAAEQTCQYLHTYHIFRTKSFNTLRTFPTFITSVGMHMIKTSHAFARPGGTFGAASTTFWVFVINSLPLCHFIAKRAVVFIIVSCYWAELQFLFLIILFFRFLHHELVDLCILKASLALHIFACAHIILICHFATIQTWRCGYDCPETGTVTLSASFDYLIILTYTFEVFLFFQNNMLVFDRLPPLNVCVPIRVCLT